MKLIINQLNKTKLYSISFSDREIPDGIMDRDIADYLDIQLEKYQSILQSHNAIIISTTGEYAFVKIEDATKALLELQPYEILNKLIK